MYPNHKLWGLAVSAIITELSRADHYWIGGWKPGPDTEKWCKDNLSDTYGIDSRESALERIEFFISEGHTADAQDLLESINDSLEDDSLETDTVQKTLVREAAHQIEKYGLIAWDMAHAVAVAGRCFSAGFVTEEEAWEMIMDAAEKTQETFTSWKSFVVNYELGRLFCNDCKPHAPTAKAIDYLLSDPESPWNRLPFDTDLSPEPIPSKGRGTGYMKKTQCPECGALKTRPSLTAYVYCDYCGSLADYDFQKAKENPAAMPGPVYEALLAQMQAPLSRAKAAGDKDAYCEAQKKLFSAWADACPKSIPPRAKEAEYRKQFISFCARTATLAAFDAQAERYQAAVDRAVDDLHPQWHMSGGMLRVGPIVWEQLVCAYLLQSEYLVGLYQREGCFEQWPDGANPDISLRIGHSAFVQGWLRVITEEQAQALLERTKLAGEYQFVPPPTTSRTASCVECGAKLEIPEGAWKTICESCGHVLDSAAPTLQCPGCGASLTPIFAGAAFNCPYCKTEIQQVK